MAYQFEIAHRTPSRTRLRWCGDVAKAQEIAGAIARDPSVRAIDYRPATGSLVVAHESDFGMDRLASLVGPLDVVVQEKPQHEAAAMRSPGAKNGSRPVSNRVEATQARPDTAQVRSETGGKWSPIVAEVEAVVLFGLILGWIRDWFAGRSLALSTVILLLITGVALVTFWLHRRNKAEVVEQELEFIYA